MPVVSMSQREFSRLDVLLRVQSGGLRIADACVLLDLRRRQIFRLLRGLREDGATSLPAVEAARQAEQQSSSRRRSRARLSLIRAHYPDFGPPALLCRPMRRSSIRWRTSGRTYAETSSAPSSGTVTTRLSTHAALPGVC